MLEPSLPFEFLIYGTAVSQQSKSAASRRTWMSAVGAAAREALPQGAWLLDDRLAVTLFIFPAGSLHGDIDNRVKPILDAMVKCVYSDDELVERLVVQKFEHGRRFAFSAPSATLREALEADEPVVYVRITDDLHEELS